MGVIPVPAVKPGVLPTDNNGRMVYIPAWLFLFLCPLFVGTRIWSRKKTDGALGADDYTISASLVFAMASHMIALWGWSNGFGKHMSTLTEHQIIQGFKSFYIGQITYKISLNLTKISIVLLYLRIFGSIKWFKRTCYVLLALIGSYCTATTVVTIFQCTPVAAAYDKAIENEKCIYISPFWYMNAAFSITTDLTILLIPMPLVYDLQMPGIKKAALVSVFGLGFFVMITSILRITSLDISLKTLDPLYDVDATMWSLIEMSIAIICACLPQTRRLVFPKIKSVCCNLRTKHSRFDSDSSTHRRTSNGEGDKWNQIGLRNGVRLTNIICAGDANPAIGSEILSVNRGGNRNTGILKTVDYSMEFSSLNQTPK